MLNLSAIGIKSSTSFFRALADDHKQHRRGRLKQAAKMVADVAKRKAKSRRVRAAMSFDVRVDSPSEFSADVGPSRRRAFFAHFLEFGTEHSRAFPFLIPAKEETEDRVVELVGVPFLLQRGRV